MRIESNSVSRGIKAPGIHMPDKSPACDMNSKRIPDNALFLTVFLALFFICAEVISQTPVAKDGKALQKIVIPADASPDLKKTAKTLSDHLSRISGASFEITDGDGKEGIALGTAASWPELAKPFVFDLGDATRKERYIMKSHSGGVYLIGASDKAVSHAVWDMLYRMGYRKFFPGDNWEVIPKSSDLSVALNADESPDYLARRIWFGFGTWKENAERMKDWEVRNRMGSTIDVNSGHAYEGFIAKNREVFREHPEYYGLIKGERKSSKLCISNPGLRKLIADTVKRSFAENPAMDCASVDPSDGGGWCECEECAKFGSISNRVVTLANEVAVALQRDYPGKYVAFYAYAFHSAPPSIKLEPNVIVNAATAFIQGGNTIESVMEGWSRYCSLMGIREYYSVFAWDADMPSCTRGGNSSYLCRTIPEFYRKNARFMSAESSDNWGPNGLGYYLASRMLWDVREADRRNELTEDFLEKCFGPAKEPMRIFYTLLDSGNKIMFSEDSLGKMFQCINDARKLTSDPAIRARLGDLTHYLRYIELYREYTETTAAKKEDAAEILMRHVYRMRNTHMVHSLAIARIIPGKTHTPPDTKFNVRPERNPWMKDPVLSDEELAVIVENGIKEHKQADFKTVGFSRELVPAAPLNLEVKSNPANSITTRGVSCIYFWADTAPYTVKLKVTPGLIYNIFGPAKLNLFAENNPLNDSIQYVELPPDKQEREVVFKTEFTGLNRIECSDSAAMTTIKWNAAELSPTWEASPSKPASIGHRPADSFFYVPKGTPLIGGSAQGMFEIYDPTGKKAGDFKLKTREYFSLPVPPGTDGKIWKLKMIAGSFGLMTVPPWMSYDPSRLMLPKEVVEKESGK